MPSISSIATQWAGPDGADLQHLDQPAVNQPQQQRRVVAVVSAELRQGRQLGADALYCARARKVADRLRSKDVRYLAMRERLV